jgi:hypothetical protein
MTRLRVFLGTCAFVLTIALPAVAQRGPAPAAASWPPEVMSLACAPTMTYELPAVTLRISGEQESTRRLSHAPGDLVTINAGTKGGISVGQEFYTRRVVKSNEARVGNSNPGTIKTTGWIRVWAVDEDMSLATITHACESVDLDDFLEPFALPTVPALSTLTGPPERDNYGLVVSGGDRRTQWGRGDYLLINRGSTQGVSPGARFVVYHNKKMDGNFLFQIGEAVAVDVKPDTATLHVVSAIDAISAGDYVGMRR